MVLAINVAPFVFSNDIRRSVNIIKRQNHSIAVAIVGGALLGTELS